MLEDELREVQEYLAATQMSKKKIIENYTDMSTKVRDLEAEIKELTKDHATQKKDWKWSMEVLTKKKGKAEKKLAKALEEQKKSMKEVMALRKAVDGIPPVVDGSTQTDIKPTEEVAVQVEIHIHKKHRSRKHTSSEKDHSNEASRNVFSQYGSNSQASKPDRSVASFGRQEESSLQQTDEGNDQSEEK